MTTKAGLDSAIDFTKFVITMDTGLIAFLTGASFLSKISGWGERGVVLATLLLLAVSVGAGVITHMRAATMLSKQTYGLDDPYLRIPGAINVLAFAAAAALVGVLAAVVLVGQAIEGDDATRRSTVVIEGLQPYPPSSPCQAQGSRERRPESGPALGPA